MSNKACIESLVKALTKTQTDAFAVGYLESFLLFVAQEYIPDDRQDEFKRSVMYRTISRYENSSLDKKGV